MKPNAEPYWWDAIRPETDSRKELPDNSDVVVVGAGLTGLSAARTLAGAGKKVLVLDAEPIGFGASTRNGGMVGGGHLLSMEQLTGQYGEETARRLLGEAHMDSMAFVKALIETEGIDCDFNVYGRYRGQWTGAEYDATARSLDEIQKVVPMRAEMIPFERQRQEVGTDFYAGGMLLLDHGGLHPAKYHHGVLGAARRAGATVVGETPVTGIFRDGSGFRITLQTGQVRAAAVLIATNGYTPPAFGWLKRRIIPVTSFVTATEELPPETIDEIMPGRRMVVETRNRHCYFRLSPDGKRLVFGARAALSGIPQEKATAVIRGLMKEIFPALGSVRISHGWQGNTGFSFNFLPHVGRHDGVWHALGFSGNGNTMAPYLGHKAAEAMLGGGDDVTAFTRTELATRFWYRGKPWFLPAAQAYYRFQDWRDNRRKKNSRP